MRSSLQTPSHPRRLPEEQRPEDVVGDAVDARGMFSDDHKGAGAKVTSSSSGFRSASSMKSP